MAGRAGGDEMIYAPTPEGHISATQAITTEMVLIAHFEKRRRLLLAEAKDIEERIEQLKKLCYNN